MYRYTKTVLSGATRASDPPAAQVCRVAYEYESRHPISVFVIVAQCHCQWLHVRVRRPPHINTESARVPVSPHVHRIYIFVIVKRLHRRATQRNMSQSQPVHQSQSQAAAAGQSQSQSQSECAATAAAKAAAGGGGCWKRVRLVDFAACSFPSELIRLVLAVAGEPYETLGEHIDPEDWWKVCVRTPRSPLLSSPHSRVSSYCTLL